MPMKYELIHAPSRDTREMILRRIRHGVDTEGLSWGAVLLAQGSVSEIIAAADEGTKAVPVRAVELLGNCPQHINTVAFIGASAQIEQVLRVLKNGGRI